MAFTTEEQALRSALDEVTLGQPEAPADRAGAVRRRHVRRRQLQSVAAMAAVAVVVAGAVVVGGWLPGHRAAEPLNRDLPSWALRWADHRDGSVPQRVLTGAVSSWVATQRRQAPLPASQPIAMKSAVWYVGQRVPGTDQVLAVFEVKGLHAGALNLTNGTRLVVATAPWDLVRLTDDKGSSAWTFVDTAAPPHDYPGFIGGYLRFTPGAYRGDATEFMPPELAGNGYANVAWLLTSPTYRQVEFLGAGTNTLGTATSDGTLLLRHGLVNFYVGEMRDRLQVSLQNSRGQAGASGYLGVPGVPKTAAPLLALPGPLTGVPQSRLTLGASASQGSSTYVDDDAHAPAGRATTVYARCYSAGTSRTIRVSMDVQTDRAMAHGVRIPCDNRQHVVPGNPTRRSLYGSGGHSVSVRADDLVSWMVAVVISDH
jgi:hypothetical protein